MFIPHTLLKQHAQGDRRRRAVVAPHAGRKLVQTLIATAIGAIVAGATATITGGGSNTVLLLSLVLAAAAAVTGLVVGRSIGRQGRI